MKKSILKIAFTLLLFVGLSCNSDDNLQNETTVNFIEVGKGALYGGGQENISQSNLVINNQTEWDDLKTKMNSINNTTDGFLNQIDFDSSIVIAKFSEVKGNGSELLITEIIETENTLTVFSEQEDFATLVVTQPFHIVQIPKTEKTIVFN